METSIGEDDEVDDMGAKKRDVTEVDGRGRVAQQVNLLENTPTLNTEVSPVKEQEKKRARRNGDGEDGKNSIINRSALSFEESDRTQ